MSAAKHHTTIHKIQDRRKSDKPEKQESNTPSISAETKTNVNVLHSFTDQPVRHSKVLLATALVNVVSANGHSSIARALIDQGSEISLITERLVQRLHLPRTFTQVSLIGVGAQKTTKTKGTTSVTLTPNFDSDFKCTFSAHILPRLTASLPSVTVNSQEWQHLNGLTLADPNYQKTNSIDLILGADVYSLIIEEGIIKSNHTAPIAQNSKLGWIVSGPVNRNANATCASIFHVSKEEDIYDLLHKFWTFEEISSPSRSQLSLEEQECERYFKETHTRDKTGRYIVKLPFKKSLDVLGDSRAKALKLVNRLSNQLRSKDEYARAYSEFITEYENLQHMRLISKDSSSSYTYYLPHHGVWRENSLTTRLRVVFNGSSSTTSGYSLNDILHTGAKLQTDLSEVLIWFRLYRYVFSTDVEKMFRQINIHPEHWSLQRILWLDELKGLLTYELTTVTYGLVCSPFLALRVFLQLTEDEGWKYPLAVPTLTKGRYVDDIFGGADSIDQAQEIINQLIRLCKAGGFNLQKWTSNQPSILKSIPAEKRIDAVTINLNNDLIVHTLGLCWHPIKDTFQFSLSLSHPEVVTKRQILSATAKIFDPLGLLAPIVITAKIFIQELWCCKLNWDDPLPNELSIKWIKFMESLQDLPKLSFPRWIGYTSDSQIELHGFCDASQRAIAAVIYIRITNEKGEVNTTLLSSKTKVAPLKRLTIPRLELSGASLLTKLVLQILKSFENKPVTIFLWTDSSITHTWITNHPSRWKEFIHNRVCYIQESLPQATWKFVPGNENPADLATRGLTPTQLTEFPMWWEGPSWLSRPSTEWPSITFSSVSGEQLEERPVRVNVTLESIEIWDLIYRYSNLTRLLRITAFCKRAISRFRKIPNSSVSLTLSTKELEDAKVFWIKMTQQFYFRQEINILSNKKLLPVSNALLRLTPFIDSSGLLRLGGRLQRSLLPDTAQHPLILPRNSPLTRLLIADAHQRTLHGGTQLTLSYLRQDYWIIGGRFPVRSFILKCIKCVRYRQKRAKQLMGQLPTERVTPARPFENSGVDYAGPFTVKTWKGKNAKSYKAYIALFVCFSTSAVHLELVTDYTTEAFIAAFKRFTARRGICTTLISDCGTNFKGANSQLQQLFTLATKESEKLTNLLANDGTQWRFNPPSAPHFGGKWEAGVKSVKYHLQRLVSTTSLTYEKFNTLLTQIEAVLNSRPLSSLSDDPEDLNALTPGHFLMGCPPTVIPESSIAHNNPSHLSRWQLIRQMLENFWTRWSRECLQRFHAMYKWNKSSKSLEVGTLVLIVDERYPPSKWPLGRIIRTHPGVDGLTRVVTVKTQTSVLKRPIVKICPLPITQNSL